MDFIEKISKSRVNWNNQSAFSINEAFQTLATKNNLFSSIKKDILSSSFVVKENNNATIDRIGLQNYWNSNCTVGSKILLTLFWGGLHKTRTFESVFRVNLVDNMELISKIDDNFFINDIKKLFTDLETDKKIAGVGYAFFSKFFQFAKPGSSYIICDQWTMKAVATYLISTQQYESLYQIFSLSINTRNEINIGLRSRNGSALDSYLSFIEVFEKLTNELSGSLPQLKNNVRKTEEILFGWDRRINRENYDNPRHYYQTVLKAHLKTNTPKNVKVDKIIKPFIQHIEKIFIFKNASYYAMRLSLENNSKIGYFDENAWLCMREEYVKLLPGIEWIEGNSKGGSETKKIRFGSITDLMKEFKKNNLTCEKVNW